ncbi:endo-1,4-beta-xylanase [Kiritimatiellota bacterium B12222]|nr:endo-1,4-beta-xylanase [Kiritimatiellota bacterium B12222]
MQLTPFDHPNSYRNHWNTAEVTTRIQDGIEKHRKSDARVQVIGADGRPMPGAKLTVRQLNSSFHFGANIFKLGGFKSEELNHAYETSFLKLFNGATVPFYWKTLEVEQDHPRFTTNSVRIDRRPPPDFVVDFCQRNGLRMHGHTLSWASKNWSIPEWLPLDPDETDRLVDKRIREIAERYGNVIKRWDVLNEADAGYAPEEVHPMSDNYEAKAFQAASRYFADDVRLDINETTGYWYPHKKAYLHQIQRLLDQGCDIGAVGLQFHIMTDEEMYRLSLGERFAPQQLFATLDQYAKFNLPIHISEITLTAPENSPEGLALQADAARNFYRLWFSHPAVEGITWWNVPDGGAAPGEDTVYSGLLYEDLTPKPSYHALQQLIHEEWRTEVSGITDAKGCFEFRGFHGEYHIDVPGYAVQKNMHLSPDTTTDITITH